MREFNGLCARVRAVRDCTRLRNRVSTRSGTPLSLNGMHIYGVTVPGVRVTGVRGARVTERERRKGGKSGKLGRRRERERKKATAAAPSTCLAAPSGVTNLNGTLCAPIASACLLILTLQRRRRLRLTGFLSATCTASHAPMLPLIMIAFKFRRTGFPSSRDRVFSFARDKIDRSIFGRDFIRESCFFKLTLDRGDIEEPRSEIRYNVRWLYYVNEISG